MENAIGAVLPSGVYLKSLRARAVSTSTSAVNRLSAGIPKDLANKMAKEIEIQKSLMIAVATGGPRLKDVNEEYDKRRIQIKAQLQLIGIEDPNPFPDVWT